MRGDFPQPFGPYELLRRVGRGGMAEVFLARAPSVQGQARLVAVKRMHPQLGNDRAAVDMLVQEAKLCMRFDHPAIAQTFELGHHDGIWYFVMEYVDGVDLGALQHIVTTLGERLDPVAVAYIVKAMARGLDHAHKLKGTDGKPLGIVHRDVSPQNVLISRRGDVKLIDFGVAKVAAKVEQTIAGVIKGKYAYMSPEQAAAQPLDARSDVFSLGICLYELLTTRGLFRQKDTASPFAVLHAVREGEIAKVAAVMPSVPQALADLTDRCLIRDRDQRPASAGEVADVLEAWLKQAAPTFGPEALAGLVAGILADAPEQARPPSELATPPLPHLDRTSFVQSPYTIVAQLPLAAPRFVPQRPSWWPTRQATLQFLAVGSGALVFAVAWMFVAWLVRSGRL
jgi:serine/threonine protein kinase